MKKVYINNIAIGDGCPVYIEADLGAKYYPLSMMYRLIMKAKLAGANAVKLQTYNPNTITLRRGSFFRGAGKPQEDQYSFFDKYQLSVSDHEKLFKFAHETGITIFSTPCHESDVDFLEKLNVPAYKIASGDCTNIPLIKYIAKKNKPTILSTGMTTMAEIYEAVTAFFASGNRRLILLHCGVDYPLEPQNMNLRVMDTLKLAFELPTGISDHTSGTTTSFLAASRGANFIERHFCLSRSVLVPDSQAALEPEELKHLIQEIHLIPIILGTGRRDIFPHEKKWRKVARRSIVSKVDIKKGESITIEKLAIKRPSGGLEPKYLELVLGKSATKFIAKNIPIKWSHLTSSS